MISMKKKDGKQNICTIHLCETLTTKVSFVSFSLVVWLIFEHYIPSSCCMLSTVYTMCVSGRKLKLKDSLILTNNKLCVHLIKVWL